MVSQLLVSSISVSAVNPGIRKHNLYPIPYYLYFDFPQLHNRDNLQQSWSQQFLGVALPLMGLPLILPL